MDTVECRMPDEATPDLQTDIMNYLQGHKGMTVAQLAEQFHVPQAFVLVALKQLQKAACVSCADGLVWTFKRDATK
jgi:predicted ArsR family transcriptional regulator